ncbi:hypothetical protein TWF569_008639 [Orbilia oligospora]|nr:hypothetical protein TWF569_008639 [Orbilia oligospora]KAF3157334.1 hypothetical protein TWF751_002442 [Orbilia oligospora]
MAFSQVIAQNFENQKYALESASFLGIAKIPLSKIRTKNECDLDAKNIARLQSIFRVEGCLRLETSHHVGVIVDEIGLRDDHRSSLKRESPVLLTDIPDVECIYGHHRLVAARILAPQNRWWTARVYRKGHPKLIYDELRDTFDNSQGFLDGEIFRKILLFQDNATSAKKWWARLSKTKANDLKQLLKLHTTTEAFKQLLPYRGLWYCIRLGSFHRLLSIKCTEELLHYLRRIHGFWAQVLDGCDGENLDPVTVDKINSLDPRSMSDLEVLEKLFRAREAFALFPESERQTIRNRMIRYKDAIPTLRTFFDDLKLLEACMISIKKLLPPNERLTVRQSIQGHLLQPCSDDVDIEWQESRFTPWSTLTDIKATCSSELYFQCAYLQIWLYTLRHFPYISGVSPRKEKGQCKAPIKESNPVVMYKLAELFKKFGVITEEVEKRLQHKPIQEYMRRLLMDCTLENLDHESKVFKELVRKISQHVEARVKDIPKVRVDYEEQEELPIRRTGRPFEDSFEKYRIKLYLPELNRAFVGSVTALEARKTFIRRFWDVDFLFPVSIDTEGQGGDGDRRDSVMDEAGSEPQYEGSTRQSYRSNRPESEPRGSASQHPDGVQEPTDRIQESDTPEPVQQGTVTPLRDPQEPIINEPVIQEQEPVAQEPSNQGNGESSRQKKNPKRKNGTILEPTSQSHAQPPTANTQPKFNKRKGKEVIRPQSQLGGEDSSTSTSDTDSLGRHKRRKSNGGSVISHGTRPTQKNPGGLIQLIQHENNGKKSIVHHKFVVQELANMQKDSLARQGRGAASSKAGAKGTQEERLCMYTEEGYCLAKPGDGADEFWAALLCRHRVIFVGTRPPTNDEKSSLLKKK